MCERLHVTSDFSDYEKKIVFRMADRERKTFAEF